MEDMNDSQRTTGGRLLTYDETSELLGVGKGTLYAWVHERRIPHVRFSSRMVRFDVEELRVWVDARRVPVGLP